MAEAAFDEAPAVVRRRRRARPYLLALTGILLVTLVALWVARKPIAADVIDRELASRGVPARYEVKRIGLRTQRLEGVSIGDPRSPDLTADWVEVDLAPTLGAPELREVRAGGVRLRGRLVDGRLLLGAVDKLLPGPTGKAFRLPDLRLGLQDARLALATAAGNIALRLDGSGNLASGFKGRYQAAAPSLAVAGCALGPARLAGDIATRGGRPHLTGPLSTDSLTCGDASLNNLSGSIDATLEPGLDGWRGLATLASRTVKAAGWTASGARAQIDFAGNAAQTSGAVRLAGIEIAGPQGRAPEAELGGRYAIETARPERLDDAGSSGTSIRFDGGLTARRLALASAPRLGGLAGATAGTPLEPLVRALVDTAEKAGRSADLKARLSMAMRGDAGSIRIGTATLTGGNAQMNFAGGEGIRLVWPGPVQAQIDGRLVTSGPGVPRIVADLHQSRPGAPISGLARMEPFVAGGSRVTVSPVRFADNRFSTVVALSGPLAGGRVEEATLPLTGRIGPGGLMLNPACAPLTFRSLSVSGLILEPAQLRACPVGKALVSNGRFGGVLVDAPRLRGTLGSSPITLAARNARADGSGFRLADVAVRLGGGDRISRLDIAELSGVAANGLSGTFANASGQIAKVPLMLSDARGRWRFAQSLLTVSGGLTVSDEVDPSRFNPLVSHDFGMNIRGNKVVASGVLNEPHTGVKVVDVALRHDLGAGIGRADLSVDGVRFTKALQPERLTRLTLGVVANVDGLLSGKGAIVWDQQGISSTGVFHAAIDSLAAPFGPVTGLKGDIRFTDLLGLVTAPDQRLTVATVNTGILVENGVVSYRLLPDFKVAVESGRWPLAGGTLTLRPTVLDFSEEAARNLVFDIVALDAAQFINKFEFKNIAATGTFDGVLPMIFDRDGGRIVSGALASRQPGGTLSYIGEVSNADLGMWGGIAFDALKAISYRTLTIDLNGKLDGEMVSEIRFDGVSRGTIKPVATGLIARVGGQLATKLQQLPFIFNIRIRAPFRGLISTARSFSDPSLLIQDQLGPGFKPAEPIVQPPVSRKVP